jgi:hypothetical protein
VISRAARTLGFRIWGLEFVLRLWVWSLSAFDACL